MVTAHAAERAMERTGRHLTADDLAAILDEALTGSGLYLERASNDADVYRVQFKGDTLYPVVARGRRDGAPVLVTFLSPGMVKIGQRRRKPKRRKAPRTHWRPNR